MLVWMDLEMTGLDHTSDVIVEIATLVTDDDLEIVAEGPDLVVHQPEDVLARMDPVVVEMHTRSGLLEQIAASTVTLDAAGAATLEFIRRHVPEPRTVPLCGNSIGTDRRFLAAYLPEIEEHLHYRSVDVSSIKELVRRWYPDVLTERGWKQGAHRALDDIRESVAELRLYRELVFSDADEVAARLTARQEAAEEPTTTTMDDGAGGGAVADADGAAGGRAAADADDGAGGGAVADADGAAGGRAAADADDGAGGEAVADADGAAGVDRRSRR